MSDSLSTQPAPPRPVFAIFEGGGARGIAHLGAAAAAEAAGLEFIGVAGASAGAMAAALLASGYRGDDLFNPINEGSDLLSRYGKSPLEVLGLVRWEEGAGCGKLSADSTDSGESWVGFPLWFCSSPGWRPRSVSCVA